MKWSYSKRTSKLQINQKIKECSPVEAFALDFLFGANWNLVPGSLLTDLYPWIDHSIQNIRQYIYQDKKRRRYQY